MNKIPNPIKIKIKGATAGYEAGEWCNANLVFDNWDMWIGYNWSDYTFEFAKKEDATLFALRWAEYG
jgi:hypothetical protein